MIMLCYGYVMTKLILLALTVNIKIELNNKQIDKKKVFATTRESKKTVILVYFYIKKLSDS